ncbi:MAG: LacI family DNA-binding transcriptional regulator [Bacteroidales bacterium]|nr:LacI family DNA-binding transcriptional regulator [Bacteroidales bacterium]
MKKVFLKDIAEKLGVSIATVSLALNDTEKKGRISEDVIQKIRSLALEMDYQPNNIARSLRMGRSKTIGLIVADISNSFFGTLSFYIQEYAEKKGYAVIIGNSNEQDDKLNTTINILRSRQVDGLIVVPTANSENIIAEYTKSKFPIILIDRYLPKLTTSYVVIDNYKASYDATLLLISRGCKNIALIAYKNELSNMYDRKLGCIDALKQAKIYNQSLVKEVKFESLKTDMAQTIKELVEEIPAVDGIYFASNSISIAGIGNLLKMKINVGNKIKLVCFDKSEAFEMTTNMISYVQQPIELMAQQAIDILIRQIETGAKEEHCKLSATLIKL